MLGLFGAREDTTSFLNIAQPDKFRIKRIVAACLIRKPSVTLLLRPESTGIVMITETCAAVSVGRLTYCMSAATRAISRWTTASPSERAAGPG